MIKILSETVALEFHTLGAGNRKVGNDLWKLLTALSKTQGDKEQNNRMIDRSESIFFF